MRTSWVWSRVKAWVSQGVDALTTVATKLAAACGQLPHPPAAAVPVCVCVQGVALIANYAVIALVFLYKG